MPGLESMIVAAVGFKPAISRLRDYELVHATITDI
jgi:hypothetical protein